MSMSMFQNGACQGVVGGGMFRFHGNVSHVSLQIGTCQGVVGGGMFRFHGNVSLHVNEARSQIFLVPSRCQRG